MADLELVAPVRVGGVGAEEEVQVGSTVGHLLRPLGSAHVLVKAHLDSLGIGELQVVVPGRRAFHNARDKASS